VRWMSSKSAVESCATEGTTGRAWLLKHRPASATSLRWRLHLRSAYSANCGAPVVQLGFDRLNRCYQLLSSSHGLSGGGKGFHGVFSLEAVIPTLDGR